MKTGKSRVAAALALTAQPLLRKNIIQAARNIYDNRI